MAQNRLPAAVEAEKLRLQAPRNEAAEATRSPVIGSLAGDEATVAGQDLVEVDPAVSKGKPVIRGTRVPVHLVVGNLAGGASIEEAMAAYGITEEQVRACLALAAEILSEEEFLALSRG